MSSSRMPLFIIGVVAVLIAAAVTVYIASQDSAAPAVDTSQNGGGQVEEDDADDAEVDTVEIINNAYSPKTITVTAGTTVTWTNQDSMAHTVTTYDGAPASIDSGLFGEGESFSFTFDEVGTYEYFCEPHPFMEGTVIVTE